VRDPQQEQIERETEDGDREFIQEGAFAHVADCGVTTRGVRAVWVALAASFASGARIASARLMRKNRQVEKGLSARTREGGG
jgi:hypothetical protein